MLNLIGNADKENGFYILMFYKNLAQSFNLDVILDVKNPGCFSIKRPEKKINLFYMHFTFKVNTDRNGVRAAVRHYQGQCLQLKKADR